MREWISVDSDLPRDNRDVLITDGLGGYAVAWHNGIRWFAHTDMLTADNHDGGATISIDVWPTHWTELLEFPEAHNG